MGKALSWQLGNPILVPGNATAGGHGQVTWRLSLLVSSLLPVAEGCKRRLICFPNLGEVVSQEADGRDARPQVCLKLGVSMQYPTCPRPI